MPRTTFVHGHFNPISTILYRIENDDAPRTSFARGTTAAYAAAARTGSVRPPRTRHVPPNKVIWRSHDCIMTLGGSSAAAAAQKMLRRCSEDDQKVRRRRRKFGIRQDVWRAGATHTCVWRSSWTKARRAVATQGLNMLKRTLVTHKQNEITR